MAFDDYGFEIVGSATAEHDDNGFEIVKPQTDDNGFELVKPSVDFSNPLERQNSLSQTLLDRGIEPNPQQEPDTSSLPLGTDPIHTIPSTIMKGIGTAASAVANVPAQIKRSIFGTPSHFELQFNTPNPKPLEPIPDELPFKAGKPIINFQRSEMNPEGNPVQKLIEGLSTPEMLATFPFAATKPVQALFLTQTVPGAIDAAKKLVSSDTPEDERAGAATDLLLNGLMTYGIGSHMTSGGKPAIADTIGSELQTTQGATPPILTPDQITSLAPEPIEIKPSIPNEVETALVKPNADILPEATAALSDKTPAQSIPETVAPEAKAEVVALNDVPKVDELISASPDQVIEWKRRVKYGPQTSLEIAKEITPDDVLKLTAERDALNQNLDGLMAKAKNAKTQIMSDAWLNEFQKIQLKSQTINEVLRDHSESSPANPTEQAVSPIVEPNTPIIAEQKYRVGKSPQLFSVVEKLPATDVEISNGEQSVRVKNDKTGKVEIVRESDLTPIQQATTPKLPKSTVNSKLKKLGYSDTEIAAMPKDGAKALAQRGIELPKSRLGKGGPGAGEIGEPGTYSAIQSLADQIATALPKGAPIEQRISLIERAKASAGEAKKTALDTVSKAIAVKDALWDAYSKLPERTDEKAAVGRWTYALQRADFEARQFAKEITKAVPSKLRREAITNWIQAEGDATVLKERADASNGTLKLGYEAALNLTPKEVEVAKLLREYYDRQLENGQAQDLVGEGLDNYITQVWKRENPITQALRLDLAPSKLRTNFQYAKKRFYDSFFEGEQAGKIPEKDAGLLVSMYDQSFNKTLAARAFLKNLHEGTASDGRPLVEVSGSGKILGEEDNKRVLITPKIKPEDASDYRVIDHPAMRGWKFITDVDGKPVLMQGDLLVHPEIYQKLRNRLSTSAWKQNPVGRAYLTGQAAVKQTMLSISGFHQVQETLHSLGHKVNPTNLEHIDFSEPVTRSLVEHGLQLSDYNAMEHFSEGVASGALINRVPVIGKKILKPYTEWLFQDYIPRLKLTMAKDALERNVKRYQGKISNNQLLELTANEANSAFGEMNYRYMGRNPTFQDTLRAFLLAPDFLEARGKFVGQALRPYGREQVMALGLLAATMYITARVANTALTGDPHWEKKHAFSLVVGNHAYTLRSIPGDIIHLISDPTGFAFNRISPATRVGFEALTGRDGRGVRRDVQEQVKDAASSIVPISLRKRDDMKIWEAFLNAFGVGTQRYDAVQNINARVADFKRQNGITSPYETTYNPDEDKYRPLKIAVESGDEKAAKEEFQKLKKTTPAIKIRDHFKSAYTHPLTGSRVNDIKFIKSLDEVGKKEYNEAMELNRKRLQMFLESISP